MDLLLDTHALIWFMNGDHQLPDKSKHLMKDIGNKCYVSIASVWEIAIKISIGKLELNGGFDEISNVLYKNDFELLPLHFEHIRELLNLEFHHRDPFDRIIISQGIVEKLPIITSDGIFRLYPVETIWK